MEFHSDKLYCIPIGGTGEVGLNSTLYGYNGQWIMVDLGVTFTETPGIDLLVPDVEGVLKVIKKVQAIVLTHAHEDHYGAIPPIWDKLRCPVYGTPFPMELLRVKLKQFPLRVPLREIAVDGETDIGPFKINFLTVTHSIPESSSLVIRTPHNTILHTGDWKLDPTPMLGKNTNVKAFSALAEQGGVQALVCDSTNMLDAEGKMVSEKTVAEELKTLVKTMPQGRIVVSCFSSNIRRILSCVEAARACKRKVGLVGTSLKRMVEAARTCGYIGDDIQFVAEEDIKSIAPSKLLLVATGSQGEPNSALKKCSGGSHPLVKLEEGDTVIFSSRIIPGNERAVYGMQDQLVASKIRIITDEDHPRIHASGHAYRDEVVQMYAWSKPNVVIPVHGTPRLLACHAEFAREHGYEAVLPGNGKMLEITQEGVRIVGSVPTRHLAVDGKRLIDFRGHIMRERYRFMENGAVFITAAVSRSTKMLADCKVSLIGLFEENEERRNAEQKIRKLLKESLSEEEVVFGQEVTLEKAIQKEVRLHIKQSIDKRPSICIHVAWY